MSVLVSVDTILGTNPTRMSLQIKKSANVDTLYVKSSANAILQFTKLDLTFSSQQSTRTTQEERYTIILLKLW